HTRSDRDWSSDVCSSDLAPASSATPASAPSSAATAVASSPSSSGPKIQTVEFREQAEAARLLRNPAQRSLEFGRNLQAWIARDRSEERRVGKEGSARGAP